MVVGDWDVLARANASLIYGKIKRDIFYGILQTKTKEKCYANNSLKQSPAVNRILPVTHFRLSTKETAWQRFAGQHCCALENPLLSATVRKATCMPSAASLLEKMRLNCLVILELPCTHPLAWSRLARNWPSLDISARMANTSN